MAHFCCTVQAQEEICCRGCDGSDSAVTLLMQDLTAPAVAALGKGCKWTQDVPGILAQAGLRPTKLQIRLAGVITLVEAVKL